MNEKDLERLMKKVLIDDENGCWEFLLGCQNDDGYGQFWLNGKRQLAHRAAYEHFIGPIPEGLELDHTCVNPCCIKPWDMEPVTHLENLRRKGWQRLVRAKPAKKAKRAKRARVAVPA